MRSSARWLTPCLLACIACQGGQAVTVPVQYAALNGAVTSSMGGGLAGATVVITPSGASALAAITTNANGNYSAASVPVTNSGGSIAVSNVPPNCAAPKATSYGTLTEGRTTTINITVSCQTPVDSLTGAITSTSGSPLANVRVVATPTSDSALAGVTTNASGVFVVAPIPSSSGTIVLSNVPWNCVTPSPVGYTGTGSTVIANIALTCSSSGVGTVTGTISSSLGGPLSKIGVIVTPYGGLALPAVPSNSSGAYDATGVPVSNSTGSITVTNLPANCSDPGPIPYSSLTNNGTVAVNITVTCH